MNKRQAEKNLRDIFYLYRTNKTFRKSAMKKCDKEFIKGWYYNVIEFSKDMNRTLIDICLEFENTILFEENYQEIFVHGLIKMLSNTFLEGGKEKEEKLLIKIARESGCEIEIKNKN